MKRILIFFVFFSFFVRAEHKETLSLWSVGSPQSIFLSYYTGRWIICLEDKTFWEIYPLKEKRKQNWYEWWCDLSPPEWLFDDHFFFIPGNWGNQHHIQVYESSEKYFKDYHYILENLTTHEKVFARPISSLLNLPKMSYIRDFLENPLGGDTTIASNQHWLENVIILDDKMIWKILPCCINSPSFEDWLQGIPVDQPDFAFTFNLSTWQKTDTIQAFFLEECNDHQSQRVYLLENCSRNQFAFAVPISLIEFADLYHTYAEKEYERGYADGYYDGER